MKFNFYQKVTSLLFLITLIIFSAWFIPFRENRIIMDGDDKIMEKEIVFDSIFSNHYNIDLYRTGVVLVILLLLFSTIFFLTNKIPNPVFNNAQTKKIIKRELIYLAILIALILCSNIFCIYKNHEYHSARLKLNSIKKQISLIEENNENFIRKRDLRNKFFNEMSENFDLENDTTPVLLFNSIIDSSQNVIWDNIFKKIGSEFKYWHGINSTTDLINTITNLKYSGVETALNVKLLQLNSDAKEIEIWVVNNPWLHSADFVRIIAKTGFIGFLLLFVLRLILYKTKELINYLRS